MNRRGFLKALIGGVATAAAVRTFPFRVYSFPTEIAKDYYMINWPVLSGRYEYGYTFYDLERIAKPLYPMMTPLKNMLPPLGSHVPKVWRYLDKEKNESLIRLS